MELGLEYRQVAAKSVAILVAGTIENERHVTDLVGNASFAGAEYVMVDAERLAPEFFDLSSGFAGTVLQKFSNYRLTLIVVGYDESSASESLRALMAESRRGGAVWFVASTAEALARLGA